MSVLIALSVLLLSIPAYAKDIPNHPTKVSGDSKFTISNPVTDLTVNDTVYIDISVTDEPSNVYGYELHINFDQNYLTYKSVKTNFDDSLITAVDKEEGAVRLAFSKHNEDDNVIGGKIATLMFSSKKSGTTLVDLDNAILVSENMEYEEYQEIGKSVSIKLKSKSTGSSGGSAGGGSTGGGTGSISVIGGGTNSVTGVSPTINPADPNLIPTFDPNVFSDLSDCGWAVDAIVGLKKLGVIDGYGNGTFRPNGSVSRAEFTKIITSCLEVPSSDETSSFTDIKADEWYTEYINGAVAIGIIDGYEDNTFRPDNTITREEAVTIIGRAIEKTEKDIQSQRLNINFNDEEDISEFAVGYVDKLYTMGIVNGDEDNYFRPGSSLTRAETAQMVWNMLTQLTANADNAEQEPSAKSSRILYSGEIQGEGILSDSATESDTTSKAADKNTAQGLTTEPEMTESQDTAEPTPTPNATEPTSTPNPTEPTSTLEPSPKPSQDPISSIRPDIVLECESMDDVFDSSNIYTYLVPESDRAAFYGDYTTLQRGDDGEAYAVFRVPYADKFVMESYFYAGEELIDFTFQKSTDNTLWTDVEFSAEYILEDGKWTAANYVLDDLSATGYIKVNFPKTVNWWTPLIAKVIAETGEPEPVGVKLIGDDTLIIPRYDYTDYSFTASLIDQIGRDYQGDIEYSILNNEVDGIKISKDGIVRIENTYIGGAKFIVKAESKTYGFSDEITVTLKESILGDINNDGIVDELDKGLILTYYQKINTDSEWIAKYRYGDINSDEIINIIDISYVAMRSSFGK